MRRSTKCMLAITTLLGALAVTLVVPLGAFAVGEAPDEMVDPVAAMEPEIAVGAPAGGGADVQVASVPDVQAAAVDEATGGATGVPAVQPAVTGSGSLPFTGPEPGLLMLVFLVGLVTVLGGVTAVGYGRALAAETP